MNSAVKGRAESLVNQFLNQAFRFTDFRLGGFEKCIYIHIIWIYVYVGYGDARICVCV